MVSERSYTSLVIVGQSICQHIAIHNNKARPTGREQGEVILTASKPSKGHIFRSPAPKGLSLQVSQRNVGTIDKRKKKVTPLKLVKGIYIRRWKLVLGLISNSGSFVRLEFKQNQYRINSQLSQHLLSICLFPLTEKVMTIYEPRDLLALHE